VLHFLVFEGDQRASVWSTAGSYLVGPDDVPAPGETRFENGLLIGAPAGVDGAVGLALPWRTPGEGSTLILQTTLLPQRERPYLLTLELTRHRVMLVLSKIESWVLFDLPSSHEVMQKLAAAREAFTAALIAERRAEAAGEEGLLAAEHAARKALDLALGASDALAAHRAESELAGRLSGELYASVLARAQNSPLVEGQEPTGIVKTPDTLGVVLEDRPLVGCSIRPVARSEPLEAFVGEACQFVNMPMRWIDMEPGEGKYAFTPTDRWIEWAVRRAKLPVFAGPLVDFRRDAVPDWLFIWENDYETLRELVYEHVRHLVTRYRRTVSRWTVVSGLHADDQFRLSFDQIVDLTRLCVMVVRRLQPTAKVLVEVSRPWAEYLADTRRGVPPGLYAQMLAQAGIAVDGIGVRLEVGGEGRDTLARDALAFSHLLDLYAELDRPLFVTLGAPSDPPNGWGDGRQADWLRTMGGIALSKPCVSGLSWERVVDGPGSRGTTGLLRTTGQHKEAAGALRELRSRVEASQPAARTGTTG